jgi:hypothetical protein
MLRSALTAVGQLPEYAADSGEILDALDDLPSYVGRRGRVRIGRDLEDSYSWYWEEDDWLELGPERASMAAVTQWAALRSDDVRLPHGQA